MPRNDLPKSMQALIANPDSIDVTWIASGKHATDYVFVTEPLEIDSDPETVLEIAKKVGRYYELSNGAIKAEMEGEISPGKQVTLQLYKDKFVGKFIKTVVETVIVADKVNNRWLIGWGLPLFGDTFTERYQLIEQLPNNKVRSTIGDKIPAKRGVGFLSWLFFNKPIKSSFTELNEAIKKEAESKRPRI